MIRFLVIEKKGGQNRVPDECAANSVRVGIKPIKSNPRLHLNRNNQGPDVRMAPVSDVELAASWPQICVNWSV